MPLEIVDLREQNWLKKYMKMYLFAFWNWSNCTYTCIILCTYKKDKGYRGTVFYACHRRICMGPFTYDVRTEKGEGVVQKMTTAVISRVNGTVTRGRGRGPKFQEYAYGRHIWMTHIYMNAAISLSLPPSWLDLPDRCCDVSIIFPSPDKNLTRCDRRRRSVPKKECGPPTWNFNCCDNGSSFM